MMSVINLFGNHAITMVEAGYEKCMKTQMNIPANNLPGYDNGYSKYDTWEECAEACATESTADPKCKAWTHNSWNKQCWLKTNGDNMQWDFFVNSGLVPCKDSDNCLKTQMNI